MESYKEPDDNWFFRNPISFPWEIMRLDRPKIGSLHSYLAEICARYEKHPQFANFLRGNPHWGAVKKFATEPNEEDKNDYIIMIYNYCEKKYQERASERRGVDVEVVGFLESLQPFRVDFQKQLTSLWKQGLINLKPEMLRSRRVHY